MAADAVVVVGYTLVDLKPGQGRKSPAERRAALDGPTLYQLLGYVLHVRNHAHELTQVALCTRRGTATSRSGLLDRLLQQVAGELSTSTKCAVDGLLLLTGYAFASLNASEAAR